MFKDRLLSLFVLLLTSVSLLAGVYNPDNIPIPKNSTGIPSYISNPDSILSDSICAVINRRLYQLEDSVRVKSLIIVVERLEGDDPFQFSLDVGNKYGIGTKQEDNGLIVTLATQDRSYYILTGYGLEGVLPDITCQKIADRVMVPYLKEGKWETAIDEAVKAVSDVIYQGEPALAQLGLYEQKPSWWQQMKTSFSENFWLWMLLLFVLRIIVNFILIDYVEYREYKFNMPMVFRWLATLASLLIWNPGFSVYHKSPKKQRIYYIDNRGIHSSGGHGGHGGSGSGSGGSSSGNSRSYGSSGGGRFGGSGSGGRF